MNVQEHEMFCEPGLENIRKSEECWDDVTHRVEETQQELGDDEMMFRKTFHDLFTPADPQTALHTWRTANTAGSHTHTHRPLYSTDLWHHVSSEAEWHHDASCTHWGCPARRCTLWRWAEVQEVLWGTSSGSQRERGRQRTDRSPPVYLHTFKWDKSLLTRRHQHKHSEEISHVLLSSFHH